MKSSNGMRVLGVVAAIVITTLAVYWQVKDFELIDFDDGNYVRDNTHVLNGLTRDGVTWAFTSMDLANWHPLTWLSLMLDTDLFGRAPRGYHMTNVLLHVGNVLLLLLLLQRMTAAWGRSAFVAALFAIHPLHVESVAWVSERKDVLSTLFWMLTMWAYLRYARRPRLPSYLLVVILFFLGLLAKPMLVTLPFVLLLLDWWPLGRLSCSPIAGMERRSRVVLEKVPMLLLSVASSVITVTAQAKGGTLTAVEILPLGVRLANALLTYLRYIGKALWPASLTFFYPHPGPVSVWEASLAALALVLLTALALLACKRRPYTTVGWFWYVGTLVPVIGIVQVGAQASADRYTYVPLIGLLLVVAWGVPGLLAAHRWRRQALFIGSLLVIAALSFASFRQVSYWRDSVTLFTRALALNSDNFLAHNNLGNVFLGQGRFQEAAAEYQQALLIKPANATLHHNLALALSRQGRDQEAAVQYEAALMIDPNLGQAHNNLGFLLAKGGKHREAMEHYREALRVNPFNTGARFHLALSLQEIGLLEESLREYRRVVSESPNDAEAHNNLGTVLAMLGRVQEALPHFREAVLADPGNVDARRNLERARREIERQLSH